MTLTSRSMEWLNQNRHRSYPMSRKEWRDKVPAGSALDCVLLDALVFDSSAKGNEEFRLMSINVKQGSTSVTMKYGDVEFDAEIDGGGVEGEESYECWRGAVKGAGERLIYVSLSMSSHAYMLREIGVMDSPATLNLPVLPARAVKLTVGLGVDGIAVNGSEKVCPGSKCASGEVVLKDGFRTSPVINNGRVVVRVGKRYGLDPCKYDYGASGAKDCERPLFFFCGQNAVNNGNIVLRGGKGVSVSQGGSYEVSLRGDDRDDSRRRFLGKRIPCIEIVAGPELIEMYDPDLIGPQG